MSPKDINWTDPEAEAPLDVVNFEVGPECAHGHLMGEELVTFPFPSGDHCVICRTESKGPAGHWVVTKVDHELGTMVDEHNAKKAAKP